MKMRTMRVPVAVLFAAALAMACTAKVEEEGRAPDVDVDVRAGELPEVDVDPARVELNTDTQRVVVPDVDVVPTEGDDK